MLLFFLIVSIVLVVVWLKLYHIRPDAMTVFTGTLGSGKTLIGSELALKLLRKQRKKVRIYNFFHPRKKRPKPLLYSTIGLKVSRKEWAQAVTPDHLLCREKLVPRSVLFIDEISLFCDQMQALKNPNVTDGFGEFCTLFRHYTLGGYIVATTQNSSKIPYVARYSAGKVLNCQQCRTYFGLFYTVKIRNISISEDIKAIEETTSEDCMETKFGILPVFSKRYDTYAFSERYRTVPDAISRPYKRFKICKFARLPKTHEKPLTTEEEKEEV